MTGETLEGACAFFSRHEASLRDVVTDLDTLGEWMSAHGVEIDRNPAAFCAIELAIVDLLAKERGEPLEEFLSLSPLKDRFQYTAVLGDAGRNAFKAMAARYVAEGFTDFKIKLSGNRDQDHEKLAILLGESSALPPRIRVDANNLWKRTDEAIASLQALDCQLFAVEEPIPPHQYAELARIGSAVGCQIVLDESILRIEQLGMLGDVPAGWLINVRVSKMGGLLRSLRLVERARSSGFGVIVGAQVGETSLLTRAALTVAQAAGDRLVAQEGAFGPHLLDHDVCDPPLMFGAGGVLDVASHPVLRRPGLGLDIKDQFEHHANLTEHRNHNEYKEH